MLEGQMKKVYGFNTFDEALKYADRNYYEGTYNIIETNLGTFAIERMW